MSADERAYFFQFKNEQCEDKQLSIPAEYVSRCTQCLDDQFYIDRNGTISLQASYPDFLPAKDTLKDITIEDQKEAMKNIISVHFSSFGCHPNFSKKVRSKQIEEFLNATISTLRPRFQSFSATESLSHNLYVLRNHAEFSASEEIFYSKTNDEQYEFVSICHSYGCSSGNNYIEDVPYAYEYGFQKPENENDIITIHQNVKSFVEKIYKEQPVQ